jgi:predicted HAD superfamily hydrolase
LGIPCTDAGFEDAIRAFALTIMTIEAHDNLLHYLELAVKPCSMDAKAVMNRLLLINLYSFHLPSHTGFLPAPTIQTVLQLETMLFG